MFAFFSKALYHALIEKSLAVSPNRKASPPTPLQERGEMICFAIVYFMGH